MGLRVTCPKCKNVINTLRTTVAVLIQMDVKFREEKDGFSLAASSRGARGDYEAQADYDTLTCPHCQAVITRNEWEIQFTCYNCREICSEDSWCTSVRSHYCRCCAARLCEKYCSSDCCYNGCDLPEVYQRLPRVGIGGES